jgi:hypothetical protein
MQGIIEKRIALSTQNTLLRSAKAVIIPDFPPPMTITMLNIRSHPKLEFVGPMAEHTPQVRHGKRFLVSGSVDGDIRSMLGESAVYGSDVGDIRPYYQDAELVISHGGHTTIMESLSFGKPVLCVVDKSYSERRNNALMVERLGVGIHLDKDLFDGRSLMASIAFAKSLDRGRLDAYKEMAGALDPLSSLEKIFARI